MQNGGATSSLRHPQSGGPRRSSLFQRKATPRPERHLSERQPERHLFYVHQREATKQDPLQSSAATRQPPSKRISPSTLHIRTDCHLTHNIGRLQDSAALSKCRLHRFPKSLRLCVAFLNSHHPRPLWCSNYPHRHHHGPLHGHNYSSTDTARSFRGFPNNLRCPIR